MGQKNSIAEIIEEILPTPLQAALAFIIALAWILVLQRQALLQHFVGGAVLPPSTTRQINLQVANVLGLQLVGQAAIILFWSIIGLAAYLIVWWVNNLFIGARNQVIITTSYTNQARRGLGIDFIGGLTRLIFVALLIASVATIPYGLNAWLGLWRELLTSSLGVSGVALAGASVIGFAAELYLSFVLFQFTASRFRS